MTAPAAPLKCSHCGAALPTPEAGQVYISCGYCGHSHALRAAGSGGPPLSAGPPAAPYHAGPAAPGGEAQRRALLLVAVSVGAVALLGLVIAGVSRRAGSGGGHVRPVHLTTTSTSFAPGEPIEVHLRPTPLDPAGEQRWIALVAAGEPDNAWGTWQMIARGATSSTLTAPKPGAYEIRLHDQYPRLSTHVAARLPITIVERAPAPPPRGGGAALTARVGQAVRVDFAAPLAGQTNQSNWITVAPAGSPDNTWGEWHYVDLGARSTTVKSSRPGRFEIRLHDGYPQKDHHVVLRRPLSVVP